MYLSSLLDFFSLDCLHLTATNPICCHINLETPPQCHMPLRAAALKRTPLSLSFNRPTALDLNRVKENKPSLSQTVTPQFHITNDNQILLNNKVIDAQSIAINLARLDANGEITAISVAADKESTHNTLVHLLNEIKGYTSAPVSLGNVR